MDEARVTEGAPAQASIFDTGGLDQLRKALRLHPQHLRAVRNAYLKDFATVQTALASFPEPQRIQLETIVLTQRHDSSLDGASKLLLRTTAGQLTEAVVLRAASGRSTLCVSSQVGCAAACRFCATGSMGVARGLAVDEILGQVVIAGRLLREEGRRLRNVVFMGMGEPFHNETHVTEAIALLVDPAGFNLAPEKVMVSSVGVVDGMLRLAQRFPRVRLALSLHSTRQDVREQLVPLGKRFPLDDLRRGVAALNALQPAPVMLEYLMLAGLTDTDEDLAALLAWSEGLSVHVNLIPYNPIASAPELVGTTMEDCRRFAARLKQAGRTTTVRRSLGGDIEAACGQLVKAQSLLERRGGRTTD
ncbi:MAG: 23S rRNA (adenine(2503)-C(2))-methyltransferase RlmN [Sandaracinaceae bacterium]|jgi:23S rRNA (adenine2503-C2)-methyltransferase|nr:23S rRNA (adenine(2503)-C(2))-methyltransferase RlmN [Sandaracinaceae bacterium]MBK6808602.1 23S rRNA (adenine(2503)-C(2))-methyltransferase RlmN [Sandaracinaceae bacterium]MBK7150173.1 23S rRNA (adenine(2503)-C(2))-methyltransferase RlmN [Sandaracinaceae bacterium]MBK7774241.1 23S rRNA (adenine(2503)-C(2))-methyltransferase RlmN [Sandaracinaceae bacterium]MBK8590589.1 23S rRNA (adenine(2503)-C(2))-methyltransferase RlmN [Sandaracinaceae bacterium]